MEPRKAPFPQFGGKSKAAHLVWDRFGNVANYVEPFFASGAVLLARPHAPTIETVNDINALLVNFWRAVQYDPESVARNCDWPVHELEIHAWHKKLVSIIPEVKARLEAEPEWFDPVIAGRWVWGLSAWIGGGWCQETKVKADGNMPRQLPDLGGGFGGGRGVCSNGRARDILGTLRSLCERLRRVRVTCGDFERILSPTVTHGLGTTGVFLDPPYPGDGKSTSGLYTSASEERETFDRAFRYCVENGHDKRLRIAFCYYDGTESACKDADGNERVRVPVTHKLESLGWKIVEWLGGSSGYGGQSGDNENRRRERIAFSSGCLRAAQASLFD